MVRSAKTGGDGTMTYTVSHSDSQLHFIIAAARQEHSLGEVMISRFDWPLIVSMVEQIEVQAKVVAQAENVVDSLDPDDE